MLVLVIPVMLELFVILVLLTELTFVLVLVDSKVLIVPKTLMSAKKVCLLQDNLILCISTTLGVISISGSLSFPSRITMRTRWYLRQYSRFFSLQLHQRIHRTSM